MAEISKHRLEQLFLIDAQAGIMIWKKRTPDQFPSHRACNSWNTRFAGRVAGYRNKRGYTEINIGGTLYLRHRLIWLAVHGVMPILIDHDLGVEAGDGIGNLIQSDQASNTKNSKRQARNKSGCTGVDWYEPSQKWRAVISSDNERIHLGHFARIEDAIAARKAAESLYGFSKNHGRAA